MKPRLPVVALIVVPCLLVGCYTYTEAPGVRGKVVDTVTGKPVLRAQIKRPQLPGGLESSSGFPFDGIPEARAYSAKNGSFDLPPKLHTQIMFMYLRNPEERHGSFTISASGYETNKIEGTATSRSRWRVDAGIIRLDPLETENQGGASNQSQPLR